MKIFLKLQKKRKIIEADSGKEFYDNVFQNFLNNKNIEKYSRDTFLGAVFAEKFNHTIKDFLERPFFDKGDGKRIDVLPTITKQYNSRIHSTTNITPIEASFKKTKDGLDYLSLYYVSFLSKLNHNYIF